METKAALLVLAALSQDSRLRVFRVLVQAGPEGLAAGKIAELTATAPSSLSFHLKELAHADLVESRQSGRFVIYTARFSTMNELIGYLTDNCCGGNPCGPVEANCPPPVRSTVEETHP
ncbi:MAG: transcriptional regulator [Thiomonas sp. 20-64-9]|jgi:DNA-binding transcriptional ArsR family regulator|uniref:ArsR/SmtB family transcription factor n=1 Tax=Thiomonas TaxID=32012 RepID=UPI000BCF9583|nr:MULTISPECIES: metalloregulator ArsR/SmtB family transcription factor [Thiomonas]OYV31009.1 MAG: transcriptional regulator [Thiomonas sp. 20-64-9]HML81756.1 metalloregulator ArsR/SmtB family transcription factor [Thiomonas arsenitoxydans]